MRKVYYSAAGGKGRKKNAKYILIAIVLLIAIFFLSFIITYNIISPPKAKNTELDALGLDLAADAIVSDLPDDVIELQQIVDALREENEYLNSQIEKYKALAEMRNGNIPTGAPPPTQKNETPKPTTPKTGESSPQSNTSGTQNPTTAKPKDSDNETPKPETPKTDEPSLSEPEQSSNSTTQKSDRTETPKSISDDGIIDGI